ncbi:MAG: rRNA maturation RNase YbeY [Candidatus Acidiferrum sp.]
MNRQRSVRFARRPLENFLRRVKTELGVADFGVAVCFVSDAEIASMNKRFRRKTGPTDVLSFPARESSRGKKKIYAEDAKDTDNTEKRGKKTGARAAERYLGDIAIAPETARRYAKKNGRTLSGELRVLILHGVLHLMGYDHQADQGEMERIERKMRRRFGLA